MTIKFDESTAVIWVSQSELQHIEHLATWGVFALDNSCVGCSKTSKGIAFELRAVSEAMTEGQGGERHYESKL